MTGNFNKLPERRGIVVCVMHRNAFQKKLEEPRSENAKPRTENRKPKTNNQKPRTKSREPRTEGWEPKKKKTKEKDDEGNLFEPLSLWWGEYCTLCNRWKDPGHWPYMWASRPNCRCLSESPSMLLCPCPSALPLILLICLKVGP